MFQYFNNYFYKSYTHLYELNYIILKLTNKKNQINNTITKQPYYEKSISYNKQVFARYLGREIVYKRHPTNR